MIAEFRNLTLGVVTHKFLWQDPEGIKTTGGFGRQIEEISRYFAKTVLVIPFKKESVSRPGYVIRIDSLEIIPLPTFDGAGWQGKLDFLLKAPWIAWRIWQASGKWDVVQYRIPGYVGVLGLFLHKLRRARKGFVWLGTDWPDRIRQTRDTPLRRMMAGLVSYLLLPWLIRGVPTFALGEMAGKFNHSEYVHTAISTVLSKNVLVKEPKEELSIPPSLLFIGRLAPEKGLPYLIEALVLCSQQGLVLNLVLVGDGSEQELREQISRYGLKEQVCFKGYVPLGERLWDLYRQADIFVLPSLSEGQGKVLIEAQACGLPIIATRVGGIPTIIKDGVNGLLVQPRSPEAIAKAIQRLLESPELRKRLSRNALVSVRAYTIEAQTEKMMQQLCVDLIEQGQLRSS